MRMSVILLASVVFWANAVFAHSGGTDANGCHKNHKTGDYHCHKKKKP